MPVKRKELSLGQISDRIYNAIYKKLNGDRGNVPQTVGASDWYVNEVYPNYVIVRKDSRSYRMVYSFTDINDPSSFVIGDPEEVEMIWIPKSKPTSASKEHRPASHRGIKSQSPNAAEAAQKLRGNHSKKLPLSRSESSTKETSSIFVTKGKDGELRWVTMSSNAFRDRDREIVSLKSLIADVDRSDALGDYGPLRWWHVSDPVPLDIGRCDFRMVLNRTLIESGTFYDERVGQRIKEYAPALQVSLGFRHPLSEPDAEGVYHNIRTFERSLLPAGRAANALTRFLVNDKRS